MVNSFFLVHEGKLKPKLNRFIIQSDRVSSEGLD